MPKGKKKRHYPPSFIRYTKEHPQVTFRVKKGLKEALDAFKGDLTYSEAVKKLLTEKKSVLEGEQYKKGYEKGKEEGFDKGINEGWDRGISEEMPKVRERAYKRAERTFSLTVPCSRCGADMIVEKEGELGRVAERFLFEYVKRERIICEKCAYARY